MKKFTGICLLIVVYLLRDVGFVSPSPMVYGLAWFNFIIDSVYEILDRIAIRNELIERANEIPFELFDEDEENTDKK